MKNPKISVITVVLNDAETLEETLRSVANQTYSNVEHVIIDGGSTDGSLDIIKKYKDKIDYWVSEPDKGIYDAMNKGIKASTGDVLYFLNADDTFVDNEVIDDIAKVFLENPQIDYVYGGIFYKDPYGIKGFDLLMMEEVKDEDFPKGKIIRHQSLFVKREIFEELEYFNTNLKIAADLEFEYKMSKTKKTGLFVQRIIARMSSGGISSDLKACLDERILLIEKYYGKKVADKYRRYRIMKNAVLHFLEKTELIGPVLRMKKKFAKNGTLY